MCVGYSRSSRRQRKPNSDPGTEDGKAHEGGDETPSPANISRYVRWTDCRLGVARRLQPLHGLVLSEEERTWRQEGEGENEEGTKMKRVKRRDDTEGS